MNRLMLRIPMLIFCGLLALLGIHSNAQTDLILEIPQYSLINVAWQDDGDTIVVSGRRDIRLFNNNFDLITQFDVGFFREMVLSPNGAYAVFARWDGTLELWDASSWTLITEIGMVDDFLLHIVWHPDSTQIATTTTRSNTIQIWDIATHEQATSITFDDEYQISDIDWSPDGRRLAVGFIWYRVVIWDIEQAEVIVSFEEHTEYIADVEWSPNGRWIASSGFSSDCNGVNRGFDVWVWDAETGEAIRSFRPIHCSIEHPLTWSPNGDSLAFTVENGLAPFSSWSTDLQIWHIPTDEMTAEWRISDHDSIVNLHWQPNGEHILFNIGYATLGGSISVCATSFIGIIEPVTGTLGTYRPTTHTGNIYDFDWNSDSTRLASASSDRTIIVWNASTGERETLLSGHGCTIEHIEWHPQSDRIASTGTDWQVIIWDMDRAEVIHTAEYVWSNIFERQTLMWNTSGSQLLALDWQGNGRVWGDSLNVLYDFQIPLQIPFPEHTVFWDDDYPIAAIATNPIEIWRISEQTTLINTFPESEYNAASIAWNNDGTLLAVKTEFNTIDIWRSDGALINSLGFDFEIGSIGWHSQPDVLRVYSQTHTTIHRTIRFYNVLTGEAIYTMETDASLLTWSPDGTRLAGRAVEYPAIQIWSLPDFTTQN